MIGICTFSKSKLSVRTPKVLCLIVALVILQGCESSPFGTNEIRESNRTISGEVKLFDTADAEGVYVWLEGIDVGTTANADGEFQLLLPADLNPNTLARSNTSLRIFFYMANYELVEKQVVINNGEFVYDRADVTKNGRLTPPLALKRFLRVKSEIDPPSVPSNYSGTLTAKVTFDSPSDSSTVIFPQAMGGLLGAILLRKVDTQQVFIYEAVPGLRSVEKVLVGQAPQSRVMTFGIAQQTLSVGRYEVIPYMLVGHQKLPAGLLGSLGRNVTALTPNYLKIPFRRENAILEIVQ